MLDSPEMITQAFISTLFIDGNCEAMLINISNVASIVYYKYSYPCSTFRAIILYNITIHFM
jgi:hypothetical protein